MKAILSIPIRMAITGAMFFSLGTGCILTGTANAQEYRAIRHERGEPYHSPHWVYDDRHHHGHYYPAIGYGVKALPPGYLTLSFGNRRFFFQGGVWFGPSARGFVVIRPPVGIIVPILPPAYATVWVAGVPYYYANDIYYAAAPGGYVVATPPAEATYTEAPAAPSAPPASPPPPLSPTPQTAPSASPSTQSTGGMWYYCDSAKTYYPYIAECKEGWKAVPATSPQMR